MQGTAKGHLAGLPGLRVRTSDVHVILAVLVFSAYFLRAQLLGVSTALPTSVTLVTGHPCAEVLAESGSWQPL